MRHQVTYLERSRTRPGILARKHVLHRQRKDDSDLARELVNRIRARQRNDGSWGGTVYETAWAMWELADLGAGRNGAVKRGAEWLLAHRGVPGAYSPEFFGSGPGRSRHRVRIFTGDVLSSSSLLVGESCLAVRSLRRVGLARNESRLAVDALARRMHEEQHIRTMYPGQKVHGYCCGRCTLSALEAFALTPLRSDRLAIGALRWMRTMQRPDGTWQRFPFYFALDVLGSYGLPLARDQVRSALPAIRRRRNGDGSWGAANRPEQTWIVCRALSTHGFLES